MAGSPRRTTRTWSWAAVLVTAAAAVWACEAGLPGSGGKDIDFDRASLLTSVADDVVGATYQDFAGAAATLETACAELAQATASGAADLEDRRTAARVAWRETMALWQRAEVMQLGPAGPSGSAVGGADLRDEVYSWPTVNTCRVDQEIVENTFSSPDFFETELVNVYGLDALEYLLFRDDPGNTCPGQIPINMDGTWDALGTDTIELRRAEYATAVAGHLVTTATVLADAWAPGSGAFATGLAGAGESDSPYASEAEALDELMRAMFYADTVLKDLKISTPAGIEGCTASACPEELESSWARASKEHVIANLEGLRMLMWGGASAGAGVGFDAFLEAAGVGETAAEMIAALDAAIAAAEAVPGTFAEALAADPSALDSVHASVKAFTDLLKGPFATCLSLRLPLEGGGDAD